MTGFNSKRDAAAEKLQKPINLLEARRIAAEYGTPDSQVDNGNLYFALSKCLEHIDAQPAQGPVGQVGAIGSDGFVGHIYDDRKVKTGDKLYTTPPKRPWVGLTDEEIGAESDKQEEQAYGFIQGALWAKSKLKEKNEKTV
jgi:hypothetical protein